MPWSLSTQWAGFADRPTGKRIKGKSGLHRTPFTETQATVLHGHLTGSDYSHPGSGVLFAPYGGQVNAVPAGATAVAHRDCAVTLLYLSEWTDPAQDEGHVAFQRRLYRDVYAATGGVPVPGAATGGAYLNYPDVDLLDTRWNTSGVPWSGLYHREGYAALRRVKARWDPREVFTHPMAVRPGER